MPLSKKKGGRGEGGRTDLRSLQRVDETAFSDIGIADDADGDALRRAWLVGLEYSHKGGSSRRGEIRALMGCGGAEGESGGSMAEVAQPIERILSGYEVY